jgi:hypothetical protein
MSGQGAQRDGRTLVRSNVLLDLMLFPFSA